MKQTFLEPAKLKAKPFQYLFRAFHHLFTTFSVRENGVKPLKTKTLQRNLFILAGAEE